MTKEAEVEEEKWQASEEEVLSGKDEGESGASREHDPDGESEQEQPRYLLPSEEKIEKHKGVVDDYQCKDDLQFGNRTLTK